MQQEEESRISIPEEMNSDVEENHTVSQKVKSIQILSKNSINKKTNLNDLNNKVVKNSKKNKKSKKQKSEESKSKESLKPELVKEGIKSSNLVIQLLEMLREDNSELVIENLKINMFALKTALMMPIEEYIDIHQDWKVSAQTYLNYTPFEELYGLMITIEKKNMKVFNFLWEERGTLWAEQHLIPVIEWIIKNDWHEGMSQFFIYERTQEIFTSMYCTERRDLYGVFWELAENMLSK